MHQRLDTVVCEVTARVISGNHLPVALPAELQYRIADPYAVRLSLGSSTSQPVAWSFARNLLSDGIRRPAGAESSHRDVDGVIRDLLKGSE
ncbi:SsgA family sporulation/cell division regulator [Streptomyces rubrogriseus]|uniref:SsgA family sporulation/cell division regulator n=1 Tax=Streptomyces rubrogriseus TaxID=194673 RepID=UPI00378A600F